MTNTTPSTTSSAPSIAHSDRLLPAQSQQTASGYRPPSLVARRPQASTFSMLPSSSGDVVARSATPPQLQPATELLNLPNDLLRHLTSFLRTANTIPAIRNVAKFRSASKELYLGITQPIPDGMMGLIEFNRLEDLKQMLVELQQSGKDVARELNCTGQLLTTRKFQLQEEYWTPLTAAAYLGHAELAAALVAAGAKVDGVTRNGWTALMWAAQNGRTATVRMLIEKVQSKVDYSGTRNGRTAMMLAAENGHTATVHTLLESGAKVNQPTLEGMTALAFAAKNGHAATAQALLQAGANVDLVTPTRLAPLLLAGRKGHAATVRVLLEAGAKVNYTQADGSTALMLATKNGHTATVQALLDAGANCNLMNKNGHTALSLAIAGKHKETIKLLRARGAGGDT